MFSAVALGFAGTTYAHGGGQSNPTNGAPTSKADCKRGGWKQYGFRNQGQCVAWVNAHGYGGGQGSRPSDHDNNNNAWWKFNITGDNNVVNIVINYIFG
jgi:hypothetical protein